MNPRLPVPCPLQPGESLPGLFSRAIVLNNYGNPGVIAKYFGLTDRHPGLQRADLRHLAVGNVDIKQLAEFTEHTTEQIEEAALNLGSPRPGGRYDEYISMYRWRYCPSCIRAGKSHQRLWLLPFVTACPEHECVLVDACQVCNRPTSVTQFLTRYCSGCQNFAERQSAHAHEVECAATLERYLGNTVALKIRLDRLMTAWYMSTSQALRPHYRFSPQLKTVADMRGLIIRVWPAARSMASLGSAIETQISDLAERWPRLPAIPMMLANRARAAGAVLPARDIPETRIELLSDDDPWWVPQQEAAEAAGISSHVIQPLVDKKQVRSKQFSEILEGGNRHKFRMVNLYDLHELIAELFAGAAPVENTGGLTTIMNVPLHEVVRDVRRGRMSVFRTTGGALADLMVSYNETNTFARRQHKPIGTMTAAEVATLLGTYHAVVANLASNRLLALHSKSRSDRLLIDKQCAESFDQEFILVGTLANKFRINSTNLAEKLGTLGIEPAPIEALVTIYRRDDIKDVDVDAVKEIVSYRTKVGRKSMVDANRIDCPRVNKLIKLVERHGGLTAFCRAFGGSQGNLSLILRGQKTFGPKAARRMEMKCGLREGELR